MGKNLVGHHIMRVRIRKVIFDRLREVAEEETERIGEHVTVSDLVRAACFNFLLVYESLQQLEHTPYDFEEFMEADIEEADDEEVDPIFVFVNPMVQG